MRKVIAVLMSMLLFGLSACGSQPSGNAGGSDAAGGQETVAADTEKSESMEETDNSEEAGNEDMDESADIEESTDAEENADEQEVDTKSHVLVVYFSATGSTERAASYIADALEADLFELEPADPYTDEDLNYRDDNSRVSQEHENNEHDVELIASTVENWDQYDTVLIGYPIWWHIAAWPVNGFVQNNDFTDKTVIPFCTSASSELADSGELLEEMAGTGTWLEGQRFSSGASEESIREWALGLGL